MLERRAYSMEDLRFYKVGKSQMRPHVSLILEDLQPPPAGLGVGNAACGWKGMALAERLLTWCIEASRS